MTADAEVVEIVARAKACLAEAVLKNLMGRSGLRQTFEQIDGDVMGEIVQSLGDDMVAALTAAGLSVARRDEWRPIESAPRDGRHFLIWDQHYGARIGCCHIRSDHDDWLSWKNDHGGTSKGGLRATHWQPLSAPPSRGGEA